MKLARRTRAAAVLGCLAVLGLGCDSEPERRRPWDDLPRPEVKRLVAALASEDGDSRLDAARRLGEAGEKRAAGPILDAMRRELLSVGIPGVRALVLIGEPSAAKPLLEMYLAPYEPPPDMPQAGEIVPLMRAVMLYAIGSLALEEAEGVLVERYRKERGLIYRTRIAQGLGLLGTDGAFRALLDSLGDPSRDVRKLAIMGLGLVGDERASRAIQDLYEGETDEQLRNYLLFVLSGMPVPGLEGWVRERLGAGTLDPLGRQANVATRIRVGDEDAIPWRARAVAAAEEGRAGEEQVVKFPEILFDSASADLGEAGRARLADGAKAFASEALADSPVRIRGHADARGGDTYNLALSARRAQAVRDNLAALGLGPEGRFQMEALGEGEPVATNETDEGRQANRRVEWSTVRRAADPAAAYLELKAVLQTWAETWRTTHREPQRARLGQALAGLAAREDMAPMVRKLAVRSESGDAEATSILRAIRVLAPGLIEQRLSASPAPSVERGGGTDPPPVAPRHVSGQGA